MSRNIFNILTSLLLLQIFVGCASKTKSDELLDTFNAYYEAENANSDSKWTYVNDTLHVWYAKDDPSPDLKYKGQPNDAWEDWDIAMNSKSYYDTIWYNDSLHAIQGYFYEDNDFYKLLGASPNKTLRTYTFNAANKLTDILYERISEANTLSNKHMDPVYLWALKNEPQEIAEIFPKTRLVPSTENAIRWKKLLEKYHAQTGN
jgi:hypothetical protein